MNDEAARDATLRQESFYKGDILVDRIPCSSNCKESVCDAGDQGLIPGLGSSSGEGNGNPLQYSCWRIPWTKEPGGLQSMGSQRVRYD